MEKQEWELVLEQVKSLREEILDKMDKQYQIIGLGIGGISVLLGLAFEKIIYPLFLFIPLIIISCICLYESEKNAILNAGEYVRHIEEISLKGGLGWERWLKDNPKKCEFYEHIELASISIMLTLFFTSLYGIVMYLDFVFKIQYIISFIYFIIGCYILYKFIYPRLVRKRGDIYHER